MRFLPLVGLYSKGTAGKIASGISYSTQPTDVPLGSLAVEDGNIYQFVRLSGTATVGSFYYKTGTAGEYVCNSGTGGVRPAGVSLVSPTASGVWTWIQCYGKNTTIQATSTFSVAYPSVGLFVNGGSGALNQSDVVSAAAIGSAGVGVFQYVGQSLTAAAGSQVVGFIDLL